MTTPLLLGVDGGGSKTVALLGDGAGRVLGRGQAASSNQHIVGLPAACAALEAAIDAALAQAQWPAEPVRALCLGMAGVDAPAEEALFRAWAAARYPDVPTLVTSDAELVLAAGTPAGWGLGLISGTGSIVYGRDFTGRVVRAGGWGHLLGDEGSGYAIGLGALRAVMQAYDGRGPQTALTPAVLAHWALAEPLDLLDYVYQESPRNHAIAALAALVEKVAGEGDEVALGLLATAARDLAVAASAVAWRLALPSPVPCALAGGVLVKGEAVSQLFCQEAAARGLQLEPVTRVTDPALGALKLARALLPA